MQDVQSLSREVRSLRREVRAQRRAQRRSLLVAVVAVMLAAVAPLSTLAANPFTDLNGGSPHNGNIDAIFNAGITKGCDPPTFVNYCPNGTVTREEMASFLARTAGLGGNPPVANAARLQGFLPNEIARVSNGAGSATTVIPLSTSQYTTLAQATIVAPTPGFVVLVASTVVGTSPNGTQFVDVLFRFRSGNSASPDLEAIVGTTNGAANIATVSPTSIYTVTGSGPITFVLEAVQNPAAGTAFAFRANLNAIFIPFGPGGAVANDETSWGEAGPPRFTPRSLPQP